MAQNIVCITLIYCDIVIQYSSHTLILSYHNSLLFVKYNFGLPAQAFSSLPSTLPAVNDVETPSKAKPLTDASDSGHDSGHDIDSCASTNIEGVHKKRKLEEGKYYYDTSLE